MNEYHRDQGPTYGQQVAAALAEKNLRQKDLAERLALSPQYLNDVVHGRRIPRAEVAERIAEITGVCLESPREQELRETIAVAERTIRDLVDALFLEVREKYRRTVMSDDEVWDYLTSEHAIERIEGVTPWHP